MDDGAERLDSILPSVKRVLQEDFGENVRGLRLKKYANRQFSKICLLETETGGAYFLKWSDSALRETELTRHVQELFRHEKFIVTPRIACNPTMETFLVDALPGHPLSELFGRPPFGASPHVVRGWLHEQRRLIRSAGIWLAKFHSSTSQGVNFSADGLIEYIKRRERIFEVLGGDLQEQLYSLIRNLQVKESMVRVHGDYSPHNILVSKKGIGVIDFSGIKEFEVTSPWFDVATMVSGLQACWHQSIRNYLQIFPGILKKYEQSFFEGYGKSPGSDPVYRACLAIRHVSALYSALTRGTLTRSFKKRHYRQLIAALDCA